MKWDYNTLSNGSQIEIHNLKKVNLKGGILIDGFSSVGLIKSILSMCLMNPVPNDLVSVMDSPLFPSRSMVHDTIADFPARIYANKDLNVGFLTSELNLDRSTYYFVSKTILQWSSQFVCFLKF
jgi:uncharacterized protein